MDNLLHKLYGISLKKGIKPGLENISTLSNYFGDPHQKFKSVHVAGTNGKGSVCIKLASCLEDAGYRVGLFTSPHISSFRERIQINGELISEKDLNTGLSTIFDSNIPATFFEITTMLAFNYFAAQNVDYVVLETGMGGRLDATNIVTPILSIITSISLDHTDFLGNTIEEIGREKAGIIKPGVPAILGSRTPGVPRSLLCYEVTGNFFAAEEENQAIVRAALNLLNIPASDGLYRSLPCRIQKITFDEVSVILDIAHNPDGLDNLFKTIGGKPLHVICGLSKNKDVDHCLDIIKAHANNIDLVVAPNGRGVNFPNTRPIKDTIFNAIQGAKQSGESVVICGSCFIMEEAREALGFHDAHDPLPIHEFMF